MLDTLKLSDSQRRTLQTAAEQYALNVDQAADFLSARGLAREDVTGHLLGTVRDPPPGHERFVGRLSIPYLSPAGVVAIRFRCLQDHDCHAEGHGKYDSPAGLPTRLYNVMALHTNGSRVGIAEGELDALVATELLGLPTTGVPGIKNWKAHYGRCFADYEEILVFGDNDPDEDKGLKHARKVVRELPGARLVLPPSGLDLTEWIQAEGVETVRKACGL